jgi:hypothetical protein
MTTPAPAYRDFHKDPADGYWDWDASFDGFTSWFNTYGRPGLSYESRDWYGWHIDCLLYRAANGVLCGLHMHYARQTAEVPERNLWAGYTETIVRPGMRGYGIGTCLLVESVRRFGIDLNKQRYTEAGYRLAGRVRELLRRQNASYAARDIYQRATASMDAQVRAILERPSEWT